MESTVSFLNLSDLLLGERRSPRHGATPVASPVPPGALHRISRHERVVRAQLLLEGRASTRPMSARCTKEDVDDLAPQI